MKNIVACVVAFTTTLVVGALVRAGAATDTSSDPTPYRGNAGDHDGHKPKKEALDPHAGHKQQNTVDKTKEEEKKKETGEQKKTDVEKISNLANTTDPVTGAIVTDGDGVTLDHKGFRIRFASDDSKAKFEKKPIRYYAKLSLEPSKDDAVKKVDASTYQNSAPPEDCPFCAMPIDLEGDVYILHRGFKIFFGCWGGCYEKFLADPAKHYAAYGLMEKDGKLTRKE